MRSPVAVGVRLARQGRGATARVLVAILEANPVVGRNREPGDLKTRRACVAGLRAHAHRANRRTERSHACEFADGSRNAKLIQSRRSQSVARLVEGHSPTLQTDPERPTGIRHTQAVARSLARARVEVAAGKTGPAENWPTHLGATRTWFAGQGGILAERSTATRKKADGISGIRRLEAAGQAGGADQVEV